jgi:hypothetical protein
MGSTIITQCASRTFNRIRVYTFPRCTEPRTLNSWLSLTLIPQILKKVLIKLFKTNEWFNTNLLSLNLHKTYIPFMTTNSSSVDFNLMYRNKKIANVYTTKFLGLTLDNTLSWITHTDTIIPILSSASFAMTVVKQIFVPGFTENGILLLFSFRNDLQINILGKSHYSNIFRKNY